MLNRHPKIVIPPELKLFFLYHRLPATIGRRCLERISRDLGTSLNIKDPESLRRDGLLPDVAQVYAWIRQWAADVTGQSIEKLRLGDKTPEYSLRMRWLFEVFPDCKVVAMVRDPRDVAISLTRVPWITCNGASAGWLWAKVQRQLRDAEASRYPNERTRTKRQSSDHDLAPRDRWLWVRFESLVQQPEKVLGEVLRFLDVEETPEARTSDQPDAIESLVRGDAAIPYPSFPCRERLWKWNAEVEPDPRRVGGWKNESRYLIRRIEQQCWGELIQAGYDPVHRIHPGTLGSSLSGKWAVLKTARKLP